MPCHLSPKKVGSYWKLGLNVLQSYKNICSFSHY